MLAPMEDITGTAFRSTCFRHGADMTFTEMTRVEGLSRRNRSTWSRILLKDDTPTVIQLIGAKEDHLKRFLGMFKPQPGFMGFNLNLGCPSPDVIRLGLGCAMIRRITKTKKLVAILKDRGFAVSVKLRLGMNRQDKDRKVYLHLIDAVDADCFIVHARHGQESLDAQADFSVYDGCVKTGRPIIANGGISGCGQVRELKDMGVKGAMIGRAAVLEPAIFSRLKGGPCLPYDSVLKEFISLSQRFDEPNKYRKNVLKRSPEGLSGRRY